MSVTVGAILCAQSVLCARSVILSCCVNVLLHSPLHLREREKKSGILAFITGCILEMYPNIWGGIVGVHTKSRWRTAGRKLQPSQGCGQLSHTVSTYLYVCLCFLSVTSCEEADERGCRAEGSHRALPCPATGCEFTTGHDTVIIMFIFHHTVKRHHLVRIANKWL